MARDLLDMRGGDAVASEAREKGVAQIVEAERMSVREGRDLIADRVPAQSPREIAAVERPAELACEYVIASQPARGVEPRDEFFQDRDLPRLAALRRSLFEPSVTVRRERASDRQIALRFIEILPAQADQFAEAQTGEGESSQSALSEWMKRREREHPSYLQIVERT